MSGSVLTLLEQKESLHSISSSSSSSFCAPVFLITQGLTDTEMREAYRRQRNGSLADVLAAMFEKWLEKEGVDATKQQLEDVSRRLGRRDLLQEIARNQ